MIYKFKTPRRRAKPLLEKLKTDKVSEDEPVGAIVDSSGRQFVSDSKEEWMVYLAIRRLGLTFTYQFPVNGGNKRGGYKIDFLVDTVPLKTMIEPIGNHWHTGELGSDDKKRQADVENAMRDVAKTPILNLWIPDMIDQETVYQKLRAELT